MAQLVKGVGVTGTIHWGYRETKGTGDKGYKHLHQVCGYSRNQRASLAELDEQGQRETLVNCKRCVAKYGDGAPQPEPQAKRTRRPQLDHTEHDHPQTPAGRRACRKAHWAAARGPIVMVAYDPNDNEGGPS